MTLSIIKKSTLKTSVIFAALIGSLVLTGCERKQEDVVTPVAVSSADETEFSSASSAEVLGDQESSSSASSSSAMGDTGTTDDGK
jgi:nitrous oxide reductase accessory protein NosL